MVNTEIIDYILCSQRWRSSKQSAKTILGGDYGSFTNSLVPNSDLKKVGKTTRPFRYDLNQIPYSYTVEVRNRFKGLDLIDRVPDEIWTEVHDIDTHRPTSKSHDMKFVTSSPFSSINAAASLRCECNVQIFL